MCKNQNERFRDIVGDGSTRVLEQITKLQVNPSILAIINDRIEDGCYESLKNIAYDCLDENTTGDEYVESVIRCLNELAMEASTLSYDIRFERAYRLESVKE